MENQSTFDKTEIKGLTSTILVAEVRETPDVP